MGLGASAVLRTSTGIPGWAQIIVNFTTPAGCTSVAVYPVRNTGGFTTDILLWGASLQLSGGGPELIASPNNFTGPGWAYAAGMITVDFGTDPLGGSTADRTLSHAGDDLYAFPNVTANTNYVFSFWAKNNGGSDAQYRIYDNTNNSDIIGATSYFAQLP